ncbi:Replication termination factor 2 RING-finger [Trinorchestia longiramus]|nr:Replication termination factor 2 RING-finger [Trinorchestia longiramus]
MGCDGGTIPKRDELVKTKQKGEQKDRVSERTYRWRHCSVSQTVLRAPVVACELGRLYNKDEVIKRLIEKSQESCNIAHIRGLKDVKELQLTPNPAYEGEEQQRGGESVELARAPWICPVAGVEMNGKHGFCYAWRCGCVVSNRAVRELSSEVCCACATPLQSDDIIVLNPDADQLKEAESAMVERRRRAKEAKKDKKEKRKAEEDPQDRQISEKKQKNSRDAVISSNGSGAGSSGTRPGKAKTSVSGLASSILRGTEFSHVRSKDFSVAKNPNHSEVYKSIFDTHKSAQKKLKSNWVTCNPQYY